MSKSLQTITIQVNPVSSSTSSLADTANGLSAGSYTSFPIATWGTSSAWTGAIFSWCVRWHWDPVNLKGYLMCKEAESTGDGNHKLIVYDAATNTFSMVYDGFLTVGGGTGTGHGYDCSALDPVTGRFYFQPLYAASVIRWTGSSWVTATSPATNSGNTRDSSGPRGICWHPAMTLAGDTGIVTTRASNQKSWLSSSGDSGAWTTIGVVPFNDVRYAQHAYASAVSSVIGTLGNNSKQCYRFYPGSTTAPVVVAMPNDLPVFCASFIPSSGDPDTYISRLMPTPSGSVCILESASPGRVWKLNLSTYTWDLQPFVHPLRSTDSSWPTMYVSTYGVYWAIRAQGGGDDPPDSVIWKPPAGF